MAAMLASQGEQLATLPARELDQLIKLLRKALGAMESRRKPAAAVKKVR